MKIVRLLSICIACLLPIGIAHAETPNFLLKSWASDYIVKKFIGEFSDAEYTLAIPEVEIDENYNGAAWISSRLPFSGSEICDSATGSARFTGLFVHSGESAGTVVTFGNGFHFECN